MEENGFDATVDDVQDMAIIKTRYQIPLDLQSCHTAIVDGYVIEGHVPVREINRLLEERPEIIGLAVAGMPIGSPAWKARHPSRMRSLRSMPRDTGWYMPPTREIRSSISYDKCHVKYGIN